ncbi:zinc ribbon domain-containing protein [Poseidonibacter ostreae]|uniref:Zinc-ribbon domain-containing protein n=1 Tax=Poseidonibacter ostreae TaxID=2654171 RepID=A0A6L4WWG9_9BACT|nr:zinc ribbon domain-containing protein [Poseidonibacter ostreae]KAB7891278.1 zinc-ribbon domain-containing protein [Poseidonibacter ostreae]
MNFCPKCGNSLNGNSEASFCPKCGESLEVKKSIKKEESALPKEEKQLTEKQAEAKSNAVGIWIFISVIGAMIFSIAIPLLFIVTDIWRNKSEEIHRPKNFKWWKRVFFYVALTATYIPLWALVMDTKEPFYLVFFIIAWIVVYGAYFITADFKTEEEELKEKALKANA